MAAHIYPSHDGYLYFFPQALYFGSSLFNGFGIPQWFPSGGGHPVSMTAVTESYFAPYRVLGWLYFLLPIKPVTAYKLTLLTGAAFAGLGWWLFLKRITNSVLAATWGCLIFLMSGTVITMFHQETVLMTVCWLPWILWALVSIARDRRFLVVTGAFLGLGLSIHNPAILGLSVLFIGFAVLVFGRWRWLVCRKNLGVFSASAAVFLLGGMAPFYMLVKTDQFSGPIRKGKVSYETLKEYESSMTPGMSATPGYYKNFLEPKSGYPNDQMAYFIPRAAIAVGGLSVFFYFRIFGAFLVATLLLVFANFGHESGFAQFMFNIHFPVIKFFRNWYHFVPMVTLAFAGLSALGMAAAVRFLKKPVLIAPFFLGLSLFAASDASVYIKKYVRNHLLVHEEGRAFEKTKPLTQSEFLNYTRGGWFKALKTEWLSVDPKYVGLCDILVYREWWELTGVCSQMTHATAFSTGAANRSCKAENQYPVPQNKIPLATTHVMTIENKSADQWIQIEKFCGAEAFGWAAPADLPPEHSLTRVGDLKAKTKEINHTFPWDDLTITPRGAEMKGQVEKASLVVMPFAHGFGFKTLLNGDSVANYAVYGGAMTGIVVPAGQFDLKMKLPPDPFFWVLVGQLVALIVAIWLIITICCQAASPSNRL